MVTNIYILGSKRLHLEHLTMQNKALGLEPMMLSAVD